MNAPELVLACGNMVGESPVWSARDGCLFWVDIVGGHIHSLHLETGRHESWSTPELPTSIGIARTGGFVVGLRRRVTLWQPGGPFRTLAVPEPDLPSNRLNEGVVAPDGSFWVGTMQDNIAADLSPIPVEAAMGALYRIAPDGDVRQLTPRCFRITNTMAWTHDNRFITADTMANEIYAYDWRALELTNRKAFGPADVRGYPDGSAMSTGGQLFNARSAGSAIAEYTSDGKLTRLVELPCRSPTSLAFAGPELNRAYITSARFGIGAAGIAANPAEGGLFSIDLQTKGMPPNLFG